MGVVVRPEETSASELDQLRRKLVACGGIQRQKEGGECRGLKSEVVDDAAEKIVCVTGGASFLGAAVVGELLRRGFFVRIVVDSPEEVNKLEETTRQNGNVSIVTAKLTDTTTLTAAFEGCRGVFHSSSAIDPGGLSGYSKIMSQVEAASTESVVEACARSPTVRNCVLTSSLLACVWRNDVEARHGGPATVVGHDSWSSLHLCQAKKLWYALGKIKSEKVAWRIAEETGLNLATICPGLITGPDFHRRNSTATTAYLKGAREMFANGVLATVDVAKLAKAHVCVYEEMKGTVAGRYICYDRVVATAEEAAGLAAEMGMPATAIAGNRPDGSPVTSRLSEKKLCDLMSRRVRRCYSESRFLEYQS